MNGRFDLSGVQISPRDKSPVVLRGSLLASHPDYQFFQVPIHNLEPGHDLDLKRVGLVAHRGVAADLTDAEIRAYADWYAASKLTITAPVEAN